MANGTIRQNQLKIGFSYTAQLRIKGARQRNENFPTREQAQNFLNKETEKIRAQLRANGHVDSRVFYDEKFQKTIQEYMEHGDLCQRDKDHFATILDNISDVPNRDLKRKWCREYWHKMRGQNTYRHTPYKAATVAKHLGLMCAAYKWRAENLEVEITTVPITRTVLPKGWDVRRTRRLEPTEEAALNAHFDKRINGAVWRALMQFAIETGARLQEITLATWSEFHLAPGRNYWQIPEDHSKTGARSVPLSDEAVEALAALKNLRERGKTRIVWQYKDAHVVSALFTKASRRAGLVDFRFHDLRHEAISRIVLNRWWMIYKAVGQMVGHSTADITDRYANLRPEELISNFAGPAHWQILRLQAAAGEATPAVPAPAPGQAGWQFEPAPPNMWSAR